MGFLKKITDGTPAKPDPFRTEQACLLRTKGGTPRDAWASSEPANDQPLLFLNRCK